MSLSYPWAAYWLRDVEPDEEPGILDYNRILSPARSLGPGVFDKLLGLIPGLKVELERRCGQTLNLTMMRLHKIVTAIVTMLHTGQNHLN